MTAAATRITLTIPVLETDRLVLRAPTMDDLPAFDAFAAAPDRTRFLGGPSDAVHRGWDALRGMLGHWVLRGFGWWTAEDRATGQPAGRIGVGHHVDWPEPELGWHIFTGYEGRGLAREAALAARGWWTGRGNPPPISLIDPDNIRSRRLAERLGARIERRMVLRGTECDVWRHPAEAA